MENFINAGLTGMRLRVKDVIIERDAEDNTIHLRLRRAQLEDSSGQLIARAPRAGIGISGAALLSGEIRPRALELIGPRILVKRTLDGAMQLGFSRTDGDAEAVDQDQPSDPLTTSSDADGDAGTGVSSFLAYMFDTFEPGNGQQSAAMELETISISNAAVSIYDEANDAIWYAPKTNLVFKRVPHGLSLYAKGSVASGQNPWHIELAADYIAKTERFKITAKLFDLVPADISDEVFVLSDLAKVNLPLDGQADLELDRNGKVLKADASFVAGAGQVGFPRFITESLKVDQGAIRLSYVPESGEVLISDSSIEVGGSRSTLNARFSPIYNEAGVLASVRYQISSNNADLNPAAADPNDPAIDRIVLSGLAAIEEGRFDLDEFELAAGKSHIKLRGTFIEGPEVPAVFLRGAFSNIQLPLLRRLWPPDAAQGARQWIVTHMSDSSTVDGDLKVNLTSEALSAALQDASLPNEQLAFSFRLRNVATRYFKDLPPIRNASGVGLLRGNDFEVKLSEGHIDLPSGERLAVSNGRFYVKDLAKRGTIGDITIDVAGPSSAALRLIDHEPLRYARAAGIAPDDLGGTSVTRLNVRLPLLHNVKFDQVDINAKSRLDKVRLKRVFNGKDIEDGTMVLDVDKSGLIGTGNVSLSGAKTRLTWRETFSGGKGTEIEATLVLDEPARKRLNLDLSNFLSGTVTATVRAVQQNGDFKRMHVDADLSKSVLHFDQLRWRRAAGLNSTVSFDVTYADDGSARITSLDLKGPESLAIQGGLDLDAKGRLKQLKFSRVNLGPGNLFAIEGRKSDPDIMSFRVVAESFDARPMVDSMFKQDKAKAEADAAGTPKPAKETVHVDAQIKTLFMHNREHLTNVSASVRSVASVLSSLQMTGAFSNGQLLEVTIAPDGSGQRRLRASTPNGGAALRGINLYTRAHSGRFNMDAILGSDGTGEIKNGRLDYRDFVVRDEPVLRELGSTRPTTTDAEGLVRGVSDEARFDRLKFEFVIDKKRLQIINEALISGPAIGATARGSIRRADGRLNIGGTLIPAYALNSALSNVPIIGTVLMGGEGQGLFGVTFAVSGTLDRPRVTVNPVSALAPGLFRRLFEFGGRGAIPEPAGDKPNIRRGIKKLER